MLLFVLANPASACGGFFCNSATPVVQEAERIVFAVDPVEEVVETHVQVEYAGPPDEFAWIVPVQGEPELFLSNQVLFDTVALQLQPLHQLTFEDEGRCREPFRAPVPWGASYETDLDVAFDDNEAPSSSVDVLAQQNVGPYDTVTLQADDIDSLMSWLADNDYAIPSTAADALAPYIHEGGTFVALKLAKGNDAGDLSPFGMRYHGDRPAVPIQLTSVAAADDLRLEVTVFGDKRAVPESYLHVELNDAAINWFSGGSNRLDVISRAADEAGGQAFATDYAGSTGVLFANFAVELDEQSLRNASTPNAWITTVQNQGFAGSSDMLELFQSLFPVRPDLNATDVYNCISCYSDWYAGGPFDAEEATDQLITRIVEPRRHVEQLIEAHPYVTRMTSSLSASEMTVDPVFTFTDAMDDVPLIRTATLVWVCNGKYRRRAPRRLELPSGQVIPMPSQRDLEKEGLSDGEYLAQLDTVNAVTIERTSASGSEVLTDLSSQVGLEIDHFVGGGGCGCSNTSGNAATGLFAGLLAVLGLRRRRS